VQKKTAEHSKERSKTEEEFTALKLELRREGSEY